MLLNPEAIATYAGILGLSAKELWLALKELHRRGDEALRDEARAARAQTIASMTLAGIQTKALRNLYDHRQLAAAGFSRFGITCDGAEIRTPLVGTRALLSLRRPLDNDDDFCELVPGTYPQEHPTSQEAAMVLARLQERGLDLWDAPIYRTLDIGSDGRLRFCIERFFTYRLGIGELYDELNSGLVDYEQDYDRLRENFSEALPFRFRFLRSAQAVVDYANRMCVTGVHGTVAIARPQPDNDYVIPIRRRSALVSEGSQLLNVLPTAFHQPTVNPIEEKSLVRTLFREIYEELLGGEEAVKDTLHLAPDWYECASEPMNWLREHRDQCHIVCTGIALNLVSGNCEVSVLMAIQNADFWKRFRHCLMTNWEVAADIDFPPLLSTRRSPMIAKVMSRKDWTGPSLHSLLNGLLYLREIDPQRVLLPSVDALLD